RPMAGAAVMAGGGGACGAGLLHAASNAMVTALAARWLKPRMKTSARRVGRWSEGQNRAIDDLEDRAAQLVAADGRAIVAGKAVLVGRDADDGRGDGAGDAVQVHDAELARLDAGLEDGSERVARPAAG